VTHTEACLAINLIPKLGPVRLRKLLAVFGEPAEILRAPARRLASVDGISQDLARQIAAWEGQVDLTGELARIAAAGVHVLTAASELYPALLRSIHDPPIVLYVWGALEVRDKQSIGVVGSRRTSIYGTETAKKLGYQLAFAGLTVFSGLARGIDTAAHQGALAAKGRTVAVLGCGLGQIYPPENFELAERIADGHGAVISELPIAVPPDRQTFPMRNRIISGCSQGLLVVEAGLNSGALISANQALEQGRAVFAVPGPIDRPTSQGSNRLIQQGAKLVMGCEDILEELSSLPLLGSGVPAPSRLVVEPAEPLRAETDELIDDDPEPHAATVPLPFLADLNAAEAAVYDAVGQDETPLERIILKCGLPTPVVSSTLFVLELKKAIKQLPGKHYVRLG
jgi:DNA processing protein